MTILAMVSQVLLIPILFLVASFFVLFAVAKVDKKALKLLGIIICAIMWIESGIMLVTNIYGLVQRYPMMKQQEMQMQRPRSQQPPSPRTAMPQQQRETQQPPQVAPQRQQPPQEPQK